MIIRNEITIRLLNKQKSEHQAIWYRQFIYEDEYPSDPVKNPFKGGSVLYYKETPYIIQTYPLWSKNEFSISLVGSSSNLSINPIALSRGIKLKKGENLDSYADRLKSVTATFIREIQEFSVAFNKANNGLPSFYEYLLQVENRATILTPVFPPVEAQPKGGLFLHI